MHAKSSRGRESRDVGLIMAAFYRVACLDGKHFFVNKAEIPADA
jgi:hypothetical protein